MFIFYGKQQKQQAKVKANNSTRSWGFFKGRIYDVLALIYLKKKSMSSGF